MGGFDPNEFGPVHEEIPHWQGQEMEFPGWDEYDGVPPAQSSRTPPGRRRSPVGPPVDDEWEQEVLLDLTGADSGYATDMSPWRPLPMNSDEDERPRPRAPPRQSGVFRTSSRAHVDEDEYRAPARGRGGVLTLGSRADWLRPYIIRRSQRQQAIRNGSPEL